MPRHPRQDGAEMNLNCPNCGEIGLGEVEVLITEWDDALSVDMLRCLKCGREFLDADVTGKTWPKPKFAPIS